MPTPATAALPTQAKPIVILRLPEVCRRVGLTENPIYARIRAGTFPKPIPLGPNSRAVGWVESEIDTWLEQQIANRAAGHYHPQNHPGAPQVPASASPNVEGA